VAGEAVGAAWPAICRREPAGCRNQYRRRSSREIDTRRLHAPPVWFVEPINATLYDKLPFNLVRDIAPVAATNRVTYVMEVNPSVPAKTVPDFIAYAKINPGKINMASPASCSR